MAQIGQIHFTYFEEGVHTNGTGYFNVVGSQGVEDAKRSERSALTSGAHSCGVDIWFGESSFAPDSVQFETSTASRVNLVAFTAWLRQDPHATVTAVPDTGSSAWDPDP